MAAPDPHQEDAHQQAPAAWDASDGARPDATDAADLRRVPSVADVEKLVDRARDVRARDASSPRGRQPGQPEPLAWAAELCTPDAVRSAEQSFAEPEAEPIPHWQEALADAAQLPEAEVRQKL